MITRNWRDNSSSTVSIFCWNRRQKTWKAANNLVTFKPGSHLQGVRRVHR